MCSRSPIYRNLHYPERSFQLTRPKLPSLPRRLCSVKVLLISLIEFILYHTHWLEKHPYFPWLIRKSSLLISSGYLILHYSPHNLFLIATRSGALRLVSTNLVSTVWSAMRLRTILRLSEISQSETRGLYIPTSKPEYAYTALLDTMRHTPRYRKISRQLSNSFLNTTL